jgi:hypothetical protein
MRISSIRKTASIAFVCLIASSVLSYILWRLYVNTYVWQSVELAEFLRPGRRDECIWRSSTPTLSTIAKEKSSLRIGILNLYDSANGQWGDDLMKKVIQNRINYAKNHNYEVIDGHGSIDRSRPVAWSKLLAILTSLPKYDYVFYLDMDAVIMESDISLEDIIQAANSDGRCSLSSGTSPALCDFIVTEDWNGLNTGSMLVRNSPFSKEFLQFAWNEGEKFVPKTTAAGVSFPFEYEQRVFHYLLRTKVWKGRKGLPRYSARIDDSKSLTTSSPTSISSMSSAELNKHFAYMPQCTMNSYSLHPLDLFSKANYYESEVSRCTQSS